MIDLIDFADWRGVALISTPVAVRTHIELMNLYRTQ